MIAFSAREGIDYAVGNAGIRALSALDIACKPLGEELHRQVQYLPHKSGAADSCELAVDHVTIIDFKCRYDEL